MPIISVFYFQSGFVSSFNGLVEIFKSELENLQKSSSDLEKLVSLDQLEQQFSDLGLAGSSSNPDLHIEEHLAQVRDETRKLLESSYSLSFAQIKAVVQHKTNYLGLVTL